MKRIKVISVVMTLIIIAQLLSLISSGNGFKSNVVESNDIKITQTDEIYKESDLCAEVSEEELRTAYKTFNQFAEDNSLSVSFDYDSFKEEYFTLGYSGVNAYLEALYGIFDLTSKDNDLQRVIENNDNLAYSVNLENYRDGLGYSDEILQAYEDIVAELEAENIPLDLCLEDFVYNYEMSDKDIFEYSKEVVNDLAKNQNLPNFKEQDYYRVSSYSSSEDEKYYYNIGSTDLKVSPNYSKYNIIQLARKGDIILDNEGSAGVFGHAGIVEGVYYSNAKKCYFVRVIESISSGGYSWSLGCWENR